MGGANISYNLRPNKFVERKLFLEILRLTCNAPQDKYVYVSMGGPQLQDLIDVHFDLGWRNLFSIEADENVWGRQMFNKRPGCLCCLNQTSGDFITSFSDFSSRFPDQKFVIWLDFADASKRAEQLVEYQSLISLLEVGDILKITINATASTLYVPPGNDENGNPILESKEIIEAKKLQKLKDSIADFAPLNLKHEHTTQRGFVAVLCEAIDNAAKKAIENNRSRAKLPLGIFQYNDGYHEMLTYTIQLVDKNQLEVERQRLLGIWKYLPTHIRDVKQLKVPDLSVNERIYIEQLLHSEGFEDSDSLQKKIPFKFHKKDADSKEYLDQYLEHYRRYPGFISVRI